MTCGHQSHRVNSCIAQLPATNWSQLSNLSFFVGDDFVCLFVCFSCSLLGRNIVMRELILSDHLLLIAHTFRTLEIVCIYSSFGHTCVEAIAGHTHHIDRIGKGLISRQRFNKRYRMQCNSIRLSFAFRLAYNHHQYIQHHHFS